MSPQRLLRELSFWGALVLAGCGSSGPELGSVSGIVLLDGKPVPSVAVHFQPASGRPAEGITNNEGRFTVNYTFTKQGALVGESEVYIERIPNGYLEKGMLPAPKIPSKYQMPFQTVTINSGKNELTFELSSQK